MFDEYTSVELSSSPLIGIENSKYNYKSIQLIKV